MSDLSIEAIAARMVERESKRPANPVPYWSLWGKDHRRAIPKGWTFLTEQERIALFPFGRDLPSRIPTRYDVHKARFDVAEWINGKP